MTKISQDKELRRNLRSALFSHIGELSDLEYQRATWLDPEMQNPHYGYVEFVECFYTFAHGDYESVDPNSQDALLSHLVSDGHISRAEHDAIWPVHVALREFGHPPDAYDHETILSRPEWQRVCAAAATARNQLLTLVDPEERPHFENELPRAADKRWP